jgi:hypothetical protein
LAWAIAAVVAKTAAAMTRALLIPICLHSPSMLVNT